MEVVVASVTGPILTLLCLCLDSVREMCQHTHTHTHETSINVHVADASNSSMCSLMNKPVFSCMLVSFPLSCMDEKTLVWFTRLLCEALLTLFSCLSLLVRGGWWWVPLQCLWVDVPLEGRDIVFWL